MDTADGDSTDAAYEQQDKTRSVDSGFNSLLTETSKMLSADMKAALAFSLWLQGKLTGHRDGTMVEGENFVGALLSDIGGNLVIHGKGVHLYVPPDALPKRQFVYIRILPPSMSSGPHMKANETCLAPIIECGPPGLIFKKKVYVTIPNCASTGNWEYAVRQEDCHMDKPENWKTYLGRHDDEDADASIINTSGAFTFETIHFTWFCITGTSRQDEDLVSDSQNEEGVDDDMNTSRDVEFKWMKPVATMRSIDGDQYEVQVQICNVEDVKQESDASNSSPPKSFCVRGTEEDISITLAVADDDKSDMVVSEDSQQPKIIRFCNLWSNYLQERCKGGPSVTFIVEAPRLCLPNIDDIQPRFKLSVCQGAISVPMEVGVSKKVEILPEDSREQQDGSQEELFYSRQHYYDPVDATTHGFLNDSTFRKLCVILDGNNTTGQGWEALAPLIGLKAVYVITGIRSVAEGQRKSPSVIILDNFFKNHINSNISETLKILSNNIREIDNHDARDLVEEAITMKEDEQTNFPTTKGDVNNVPEPDLEGNYLPSEETTRKIKNEKQI